MYSSEKKQTYNVVMIEMENRLEKLENIGVMLVKAMMYNHFDCLKVCKPVNLVNIGVMLENIEEMLVNTLVRLVNKSVMHCFHHDHLENRLAMLDLDIYFLIKKKI
jgi:hypothetical protein